jgi:glycosyltransferase involved in cell wall biosynthesis
MGDLERAQPPWRVLLMARALDTGGTERQLTEIAKALTRSRFEPHVGTFVSQGMRREELARAGVPVVEFPVRSLKSVSAARGALQLARYIRRQGIRLVHTWDYPLTAFAIPVARVLTSAVAVSSQRAHRLLTPEAYAPLVRATDRLAHAVVVNCEFLKNHLALNEGVPLEKIRLCYNGIDTELFHGLAGACQPPLADGSLVIGAVCVLRPEKDLQTLLDAFARVRRIQGGLKLAVVGSGSVLPDLERRAKRLGIMEQCVFHPATEKVVPWYHSIDIFVLPSRSEGLPNALMEAMACGCCVIASRVGGISELVRHEETGLLFDPGDAGQLAGALGRLIENAPLRNEMAAAARRQILDRFSVRASADRMGEIYSELIERFGER